MDTTHNKTTRKLESISQTIGEYTSCQTKRCGIYPIYRLVNGVKWYDGHHRAENLLASEVHGLINIDHQGRGHDIARAHATDQAAGSLGNRFVDPGHDPRC